LARAARAAGWRATGLVLMGLALSVTGCIPLIPERAFLGVANAFALDPTRTCDELKVSFGVPQVTTVPDPGGIGLAYEEARVTNATGRQLRVWHIPHPESRGTIVLSNGAVGEVSCFLVFPLMLHDAGWSFVMYDFQGFGGSEGEPDLDALYGDLGAVVDWTLENTGVDAVTLMGVSLGTIPSVSQAAARPEAVRCLVLDGLISLRYEAERLRFLLGGRPERYYSQFADVLRLEVQIRHVTQPTLAVVYGLDEYVTSSRVGELTAQSPAAVTLLEFPGLPHARGPYLEMARYFEVLGAFLDDHAADGDGVGAP
jgi:pimeloyl-ACP methyl ester carboxylesterase